ncbi:MAG: hypothetical protein QN178_16665, partial [Armatimonadota bacterium]|nr:hypothetical protein [Armatimonadota bacterium]
MLAVVLLALVVVVRPGLGQQPAAPSAPGHPAVPAPLGTIPQLGTASLDPTRPAVPAAKIRAVKILADWSVIEPQRGQTSWSHLDRLVATAVRERAAPVVVLAHTPRRASIGSGADLTRPDVYSRQPPRDVQDWERFVTAVAERYRGRVSEWQVWPQLGLPQFRGTGSEYVALLRAARGRLLAVDPRARVAMATPSGIDLSFVLRVAQSAPGAFDAVSLTPRGVEPESLLRPLSVLAVRLKPLGKAIWLDWGVDPSRRGDHASGLWARVFGVAQAAGVERVFAEDVGTPVLQAAEVTLRQPFTGYLVRDPDVFALVLGTGTGAVLLAWASVEGRT